MKKHESMKDAIETIVAKLFDNNMTPMEHIGIDWDKVEMLERKCPGIVVKLPIDEGKITACCGN